LLKISQKVARNFSVLKKSQKLLFVNKVTQILLQKQTKKIILLLSSSIWFAEKYANCATKSKISKHF